MLWKRARNNSKIASSKEEIRGVQKGTQAVQCAAQAEMQTNSGLLIAAGSMYLAQTKLASAAPGLSTLSLTREARWAATAPRFQGCCLRTPSPTLESPQEHSSWKSVCVRCRSLICKANGGDRRRNFESEQSNALMQRNTAALPRRIARRAALSRESLDFRGSLRLHLR
jgi:hypothetical protein